jgi:hypothetical protein
MTASISNSFLGEGLDKREYNDGKLKLFLIPFKKKTSG